MEDPFNKKVVVQSADSSNLFYPAFDTSYYTNLKFRAYCYELILPPQHTMQEALQMMHQNICMFFKLTSALEKRKTRCWVLSRLPSFDSSKLLSLDTTSLYKESADHLTLTLINEPISQILAFIDRQGSPNLIDETNFKMRVNLQITTDENIGLEVLNNALEKYGLVLREQQRELQMLIINKIQ
jgi:hypothetical protein